MTVVNMISSCRAIHDPKGELQPTALAGSQNIMLLYRFTLDLVPVDVLATWVGAPPLFFYYKVASFEELNLSVRQSTKIVHQESIADFFPFLGCYFGGKESNCPQRICCGLLVPSKNPPKKLLQL